MQIVRTTGARSPRCLAALVLLSTLLAGAIADSASARWARVSATPSRTQPYLVCPPKGRGARCELVQDPTLGVARRGPLAAGAITKGPEQEASPALEGTGIEGGYSPADLRSAYRLPSATAGGGQTVAIVDAFDDPKAESDLAVYRSHYGLGECKSVDGCFRKLNQRGGKSLPATDRTWAREISLDLDMVSAVCPNCHILLVEADNAEGANLAAAQDEAVAQGATEVSDSYEEPQSAEYAAAYDHPGIPVAAAAGDNSYGVVSPASSSHVIAVGGTTLLPAAGHRGWTEAVWHSEGGGTGSGCSIEPKPAWQTDLGCPDRTTNDIAAVADPNTPLSAYDSFEVSPSWMLAGGTSASSPIVAAAMALATPYTRSFDGAQALYLEVANGGTLNDVTSGANGSCGSYLCEAKAGYDGPSGLGTLSGAPFVPPPSAATGSARSIAQGQATLVGSVEPHGVPISECGFQYGTSMSYTSYAPCTSLPAGGIGLAAVSAPISGLTQGTLYHFRLHVTYAGGSAVGADVTFTTLGAAPSVYAGEPSNVARSSAGLNARVNPNGAAVTACAFEYGPSSSYGAATPCSPPPGEGMLPIPVSATVTGLSPHGTYHFRIVAANANGTTYGADQSVTLLPLPPSVTTGAATAIGRTNATLNAIVDANGGALTTCAFEFNSAETLIPCALTPPAPAGAVAVSAIVAGLAPGTTFRYRIVAANAGGATYGALAEFSALRSSLQRAAIDAARLASTTLFARASGTVLVKLRCPARHARCRGTLTLRTRPGTGGPEAGGARRATRALGSASFAAPPHSTVVLHVRLAGFARALLTRSRTLRASATVRTFASGGRVTAWHAAVVLRRSAP